MPSTTTLSFRVSAEKAQRLETIARLTDRTRGWLLERALDRYLEENAWQLQGIEEGMADASAGRVVDGDAVDAWLASWGTDDELDAPLVPGS